MQVFLPKLHEDGTRVIWKKTKKEKDMIIQYKHKNKENMMEYVNKLPIRNEGSLYVISM